MSLVRERYKSPCILDSDTGGRTHTRGGPVGMGIMFCQLVVEPLGAEWTELQL